MASISATAGRSSGEHGRKNTVSRRAWWKKPPVRSSSGIAGSRELEAARTRRARRAAETRVAEERVRERVRRADRSRGACNAGGCVARDRIRRLKHRRKEKHVRSAFRKTREVLITQPWCRMSI